MRLDLGVTGQGALDREPQADRQDQLCDRARVAGHDRIFAVGDIALTGDQPLPRLAQPALQMGKHATDQLRRLTAGRPTAPFRYRD